MIHRRHKLHSPNRNDINHSGKEAYRDDNTNKAKDGSGVYGKEEIHVNDAKLGALLYFPLIGIVLTSCLGDMYNRNSTMHREPNTARSLLVDCPVKDPDQVWLLLVCCYLMVVVSIVVLCHTLLGVSFSLVRTTRSKRMRIVTCRICLLLFYCGFYNWDICMGNMPYLKKATTQVYFTCIVLFISSPTLSMPIIIHNSKSSSSKAPRWPLFMIKMMVFILYADAGWHKLHLGFSPSTLRAYLVHHWIYYERSLALVLLDYPLLTSTSAYATLIFECTGWLLVIFDCDRVAAVVALSFHIGIYLAMNVDFLSFWCCSFVFFFVPSIISSNVFQSFLKRLGGEKPVSVPLGCSLLVGGEVENRDISSSVGDCAVEGCSNSKLKRKRKSFVLMAVSFVLVMTYKGFYPYAMMLPVMPESPSPSFLSHLYEQFSGMTFKPFNSYDMYSSASFPIGGGVAFIVLKKRRTSELTATDNTQQRVKWIPHQASDFYLYSNMLEKLNSENMNETFTLDSFKNKTPSQRRIVTRCSIFACLARQFILNDSAGEKWTKDGMGGGIRSEVEMDSFWDVDSIELVEEWYNEPNNSNNGDVVEATGVGRSLQKNLHTYTYCGLGIGGDNNSQQSKPRRYSHDNFNWYEDGSCADILADLDANARSFNTASLSSGGENPFYIIPVESRTRKHKNRSSEKKVDAPIEAVFMIMLIMAYKTYLLDR